MRSCPTLFILTLAATAALAAAPEVTTDVVCTVDCHEAPLRDVAALLEQSAGIVIELGPGVAERAVTLNVTNMPLRQLLNDVATRLHLRCDKLANRRYRFTAVPEVERPEVAPRHGPQFKRQMVKLQYALPSRIAGAYGRPAVTPDRNGQVRLTDPGDGVRCLGVGLDPQGGAKLLRTPERDRASLVAPSGIKEFVGYDLLSAMILAGEPAAVNQIRSEIEALDVRATAPVDLTVAVAVLDPADAAALGVPWAAPQDLGRDGQVLRAVVGSPARLMAPLRGDGRVQWLDVPGLHLDGGEPLLLNTTRPVADRDPATVILDVRDGLVQRVANRFVYEATDGLLVLPWSPDKDHPESLDLRLIGVAADGLRASLELNRVANGLRVEPGQVLALVSSLTFDRGLPLEAGEAAGRRLVITFLQPTLVKEAAAQP